MTMLLTSIPVFAGIGAFLLGWERPGWRHWSGVVISVVGVALVVAAAPSTSGHPVTLTGNLLGIITAASWATYTLMLRPLMKVYSPLRISLIVLLIGLLALLPLGIPEMGGIHLGGDAPRYLALLVYAGVGAIALTNIMWYTGVARLGPSRTTVYMFLQPLFGVLAAVMILGESLSPLEVLGGATILAGILYGRTRQTEPDGAPLAE
jgi:drug/metabolite transporter (DMT)-like permease